MVLNKDSNQIRFEGYNFRSPLAVKKALSYFLSICVLAQK